MFFRNEHNPPHIHAIYDESNGLIDIETIEMIEGDLPGKTLAAVKAWVHIYQCDLKEMREMKKIKKLPPI